jgi:hypothetical protein
MPMLSPGCAPKRVTSGVFTQLTRIEEEFKRGVSTKGDVRRVLGAPSGSGSAILPPDRRQREVWYYEDIEVLNITPSTNDATRANVRQQILLVFFDEGVFDGFMWFSNAAKISTDAL